VGTLTMWPDLVRKRLGALGALSLRPADTSTAEGRARERHRRVALSAVASMLAKLLSVGTALISVPLTLHYLGVERFGMWMTISSLIAMLAFADFGIANGVLSAVAQAHGKDDAPGLQRAVSSGFFMLCGIALLITALFALSYPFVRWHAVFNVQGAQARAEAGPALAVFVGCFAAAIALGMVQRVQIGLQQGFVASLWQCVGSVCGLLGVLLAIALQAGLPWLVAALAGAPLLVALLNSLHFYGRSRPDLRPRWRWVSADAARRLAATGWLFFVLQVTVAVAYTSDSLVIAQLLGAAAVAEYAVPEKLFGLIGMGVTMALAPLWPAYGEAVARGDGAWVQRTLKRSLQLAVGIAAVASLLLLVLGPQIMALWVGAAVLPPMLLLLALACWKVVEAAGVALAMFLNGAQVVRLQVWCALPTAAVAIGLKLLWVPLWGVAGAVWASVAAYLVFTALPVAWRLPGLLRALPRAAR
jgi:O-antigen/teichoic acid export membrane protein